MATSSESLLVQLKCYCRIFVKISCLDVSLQLYTFCRISCWTVLTQTCTSQTSLTSLLRRAPVTHRTWSCRSLTDAAREFLDHRSANER